VVLRGRGAVGSFAVELRVGALGVDGVGRSSSAGLPGVWG